MAKVDEAYYLHKQCDEGNGFLKQKHQTCYHDSDERNEHEYSVHGTPPVVVVVGVGSEPTSSQAWSCVLNEPTLPMK